MKDQNDNQRGDDSEETPLLHQGQQPSQQEAATFANAYPQPVGPVQFPMNINGNNPNPMAALATLAAQYEQAGYSASDAAAAAASMAAYQQQQQHMYAAASAFGYPPHTQAQMYYPSQTQHYLQTSTAQSSQGAVIASSLSPQGAPVSSRPPRSSRRASSPILTETGNANNSNSLPPLQDIFSNSNADAATGFNSSNNNSNYGSIVPTNSPIWSAPPQVKSPTSSNYVSGVAKRVTPVLIRTSSSGAIGRPLNSPKQVGPRGHRRSSSDLPINRHRRTGSGESPLLPPISGGSGHRRSGSFGGANGTGNSVFSGSDRPRAFSSGSLSRPRRGSGHRRTASSGSVGTFTSQLSTASVRSNIAKSSMFGGFDPYTGQVQMHFPFEAVRLVFVDDEQDPNLSKEQQSKQQPPVDPHATLTMGHLYMEGSPSDFEDFEDYTNITNAMEEGLTPQWETLDRVPMNDGNNLDLNSIIKPASYVLPVSAKVYKRMVGEISDAHYMPCGLFFCGHHEDVSHPSIAIAVAIVILLFGFMAYVAFFIEGS